ncbi:TPA: hypothetical protein RG862_003555 [Enterobacter ludwigii]|nr:hypothetical protein [Enterobacter ludwigii]
MKITLFPFFMAVCISFSSYAVDVGDITSFINSDTTVLSKEIRNTTDNGRLINISIEKLDSPLDGGKVIPMAQKDEILLTPSSMLMPAKSSEVIRFFYKGPEDDKERYYRIVWFDQALSNAQNNGSKRSAVATASARIGTILVVAPRKVNYSQKFENGVMTNTGNATLRIIAYGPCLKASEGKECKENYYLMPGKSRRFTHVDTAQDKGRVALWQGETFIPIK